MGICFYCSEDSGDIILPGRLPGDVEAPRKAVWTHDPCPKCKEYMEQGVMLVCVDEEKTTDKKNPWRTGLLTVVRDEAIQRIFDEETSEQLCKSRFGFLPEDAWKLIGLPEKGDVDEGPN